MAFTRGQRVHGASFNQCLDSTLAHEFGIDARTEIGQRLERPTFGARPDNFTNRAISNALDCQQAETHAAAFDGEAPVAIADIRP